MALNRPNSENTFAEQLPYVKYNSQDGTFLQVDRQPNGHGVWETTEVDVIDTVQFVVDFEGVKTGWINFSSGGPPVKLMAPIGDGLPKRPEDKQENGSPLYKFGFEVRLVWPKDLGGGLREFTSNAKVVVTAFDELHDRYLAAPESKTGKLPIVRINGTTKIKTSMGSSYHAPNFEIVGWITRPAVLDAKAEPLSLREALKEPVLPVDNWEKTTPPFTGDRKAKPPAPPRGPALDADDFG